MTATSSVKIRSMDMPIIDRVFGMEDGFVLNFSNQNFAEFFRGEVNVDIDNPHWAVQGGSKAKRLRYYLRQADRQKALDTLNALWVYREASRVTVDYPELDDSVLTAYFRIIERLGGKPPEPAVPTAAHQELRIDAAATSALAAQLLAVSTMDPQARGYAFEKFLKDVFDAYGMSARASFRLTGEQNRRQFRARRTDLFARGEMEWPARCFIPARMRVYITADGTDLDSDGGGIARR